MSDTAEVKVRELRALERKRRKYLTELSDVVLACVKALDQMGADRTLPDAHGRNLAKVANALERSNDMARYFGLGIDFRIDKKNVSQEAARHLDASSAGRPSMMEATRP